MTNEAHRTEKPWPVGQQLRYWLPNGHYRKVAVHSYTAAGMVRVRVLDGGSALGPVRQKSLSVI